MQVIYKVLHFERIGAVTKSHPTQVVDVEFKSLLDDDTVYFNRPKHVHWHIGRFVDMAIQKEIIGYEESGSGLNGTDDPSSGDLCDRDIQNQRQREEGMRHDGAGKRNYSPQMVWRKEINYEEPPSVMYGNDINEINLRGKQKKNICIPSFTNTIALKTISKDDVNLKQWDNPQMRTAQSGEFQHAKEIV